ncbi:Juvenile hormone esterase [Pseudolycoriella hygida]|uniref:Carboxylic ester hydrolase n=1 Tax=Pseudolycoriella hygida TaxID=35572 RepID=A0A9Q0MNT2_9DIPT|nr:Juvenile hormone esterase [Pseudolycoriella hygida]
MRLCTLLLFSLFFNICWSYQVIKELRKKINDGEILGRYMTSETGRTVQGFIGIPFASPPVNDLRFKAPQKVTPWNNTLFTQNQRSKCPHIDTIRSATAVEGDEDCLYLNVYVPQTRTSSQLDVLVWFHGGGFTQGHGGPHTYSPDYLLEHDVILVSGNYRLGPLGFLSTEDRNSAGNFGLKDQAFLLQWVHDNIEHFGGNKNSVTIWGESAGAVSVAYQMISPLSEGLFNRAIMNSGVLTGPARSGVARQQAIRLAEQVNCPVLTDTSAIIECLRQVSAEAMIHAGGSYPIVVESFETDEPAFIDQRNYNNRFSHFAQIPLLVGMNSEESLMYIGATLDNPVALDALLTNWDLTLPGTFGYSHLNVTAREEITRSINEFYFGNAATPTNPLDKQSLLNLFTDLFLTFIESVQGRLEQSSHSNTYLYLFTHKGKASFSTATNYYGTSHADDLIPLFPLRKTVFYSSLPSAQDRELTKVMSRMWTNFARFGNPTPSGSEETLWPSVTSNNFSLMQYMQIGNENGFLQNEVLQVKQDYYSERAEFWKRIRQDYGLNSWFEGDSSISRHFL